MKILFAGSAPFSLPVLETLVGREDCQVSLLTAPDRKAGRGMQLSVTPTKAFAQKSNLEIIQPEKLRGEIIREIASKDFDVLVCVAYGKIFGPKFLSLFSKGSVNIHPSLLPRFRGAAPIPASLLAGDKETGVSLQKVSLDMDCGDIILQSHYTIGENDNTETLMDILSQQSCELIEEFLNDFDNLYASAKKQTEENVVYCQKIDSSLGYINWQESAKSIERMCKALCRPYSGVKAMYAGEVLKIWKARVFSEDARDEKRVGDILGTDENYGVLLQCKKGILGLLEMQLPGRKKLFWKDLVSGNPNILQANLKNRL